MENITTEEHTRVIRSPQKYTFDDGNQTTESFPSTQSQDDPYKYRIFANNEESQHLGTSPSQDLILAALQQGIKFNQSDCSSTPFEKIKKQISYFMENSYDGNLKAAIQDFEAIEKDFRKILPEIGKEAAAPCREIASIYYRGHMDDISLYWLRKCEDWSQDLREGEDPVHLRKLYLCMADILTKKDKYEEAELYVEKGENVIKEYLKTDFSYEGIRALSWVQTLKGHVSAKKGEYEEAEEFYKKSIELKKLLQNSRLEALAYDYLADFYITYEKLEKVEGVLEKVLEESRKFRKGYYTEARYWRNKGRVAFLEKKKEKSRE